MPRILRPLRTPPSPLTFPDHPSFSPCLTPEQCIRAGIFGGVYFNPVGGKPGVLGRYVDIDHTEFPGNWFSGLDGKRFYLARRYDMTVNKYGVVAGSDQAQWETHGWIHPQDPRGWFQWYCRFFLGRRTADDSRQIKRWQGVCGERGRWRTALRKRVGCPANLNDFSISPRIRQTLLHWAFELRTEDFVDV